MSIRIATPWEAEAVTAIYAPVVLETRNVGFKCGAWRDVGWWQRPLREPVDPVEPRAFNTGT